MNMLDINFANLFKADIIRHQLARENRDEELRNSYDDESMSFPELSTNEKWNDLVEFKEVPPIRLDRLKSTLKFINLNGSILDIGSGWGDIVPLLLKENKNITFTGIDFSQKLIELLRNKFPGDIYPNLKFVHGDLSKIQCQYDNILALELLEHIPSKETFKFLNQIKKFVNPGGRFIASVPLNEDLKVWILKCPHCGKMFNRGMGHVRQYTQEIIFKELYLAGFKVRKYKYVFWNNYTAKLKITSYIINIKHFILLEERIKPADIIVLCTI